jgi:RimJ/RimL family protein N-acetyltransferase
VAEVALRPVVDSDLDALFAQMRDPESVQMAAFTAENPDDRTAFDVHMAKVRTSPGVTTRAVAVDGRLAGSIASFVVDGDTEVTYWIDRSFWGQGIAGRALALLLESVRVRRLFARAASDNVRSLKVLQRAGFAVIGTQISFANGRNEEIEETILRPDEPAKTAPSGASSGDRQTY